MRDHFIPIRIVIMKKTVSNKCGEGSGEIGTLCIAGEKVK